MKTYHILYEQLGGYSTSPPDPRRVHDPGEGLRPNERVSVCLSSDDFRLTPVRRWTVRLVTLPDWLSPQEWIRERVHWKWAWGFGCDPTWPESYPQDGSPVSERLPTLC